MGTLRGKTWRYARGVAALIVMLGALGSWAWALSTDKAQLAPTAVLRVDTSRLGNEFAPGAVGLSTEAREFSTDHLSSKHYRLVRLMRLLGPSVLRIGGNTVDFSWWTSSGESPPAWATSTVTPADLSALHGLLVATGWRVLLGVDLGHFEPERAANEARYASEILGNSLLGIEIGNEPDDFSGKPKLRLPTYSVDEYLREAEVYNQALNRAVPAIAIYGPALSQTKWLTEMGTAARTYAVLTQHYYPTGNCPNSPLPAASALLSPSVRQNENETLGVLARAEAATGRPTLIGETNGVACPGAGLTVGLAQSSALWALDWALRATSTGVKGVNFHDGLDACASQNESPVCAPNETAAYAGGVTAQPEYYGLLAARQLEGGRFVPARLIAPERLPDLTTWATIDHNGTVKVVIDNLATGGLDQPVSIPAASYNGGVEETLNSFFVNEKMSTTLGIARITNTAIWSPKLVKLLSSDRSFRVIVRPASAVIVTLYPRYTGNRSMKRACCVIVGRR